MPPLSGYLGTAQYFAWQTKRSRPIQCPNVNTLSSNTHKITYHEVWLYWADALGNIIDSRLIERPVKCLFAHIIYRITKVLGKTILTTLLSTPRNTTMVVLVNVHPNDNGQHHSQSHKESVVERLPHIRKKNRLINGPKGDIKIPKPSKS